MTIVDGFKLEFCIFRISLFVMTYYISLTDRSILFHEHFNSAIHKATGLMVHRRSMILPGTVPETPISHEWSQWLEWPLGVVPTGKNAYRRLCE